VWQAETGFIRWNWYQGDYDFFLSTGEYTQKPGSNPLAAQECGIASTAATTIGEPGPGKLAILLVSGLSGPDEGDLGTDSAGNPRPNDHPCP
jgi:hypothetical protein